MTRCGQMSLRPSEVRVFPRWSVKVCSPGIWFTYRTSAYPLTSISPSDDLPMRKPLPGSNSPHVSIGTNGSCGAPAPGAAPPVWNAPLHPSDTQMPVSS